jgi:4-hydroxybenzoate polyprenyltransferase
MNEENGSTEPPPDGTGETLRRTAWLLAGFLPSVIWIAYLRTKVAGRFFEGNSLTMGILWVVIFSAISGAQLSRRKEDTYLDLQKGADEDTASKFGIGVVLAVSFIFLNALIVANYILWRIAETVD